MRIDAGMAKDPRKRDLRGLIPTALVGTVAGCALLLATPERAFEVVVPFLVLGATVVLACQGRLRNLVGHPRDMTERRRTVGLHIMVGLGAAYGGYFGAALGIMLVAGLGLVLDESLTRVNALKNAISAVVAVGTVVAFGVFGPVDWAAAGVTAPPLNMAVRHRPVAQTLDRVVVFIRVLA